jgi:hypothetical protein
MLLGLTPLVAGTLFLFGVERAGDTMESFMKLSR